MAQGSMTEAVVSADGALVLDPSSCPPLAPGQKVLVTIFPLPPAANGSAPSACQSPPAPPEAESVTLGLGSRSPFVEDDAVQGSGQPPRGLLPTPSAVAAFMASQSQRFSAMAPRARQRVRDDCTLGYYFGGEDVAFRFTDQGVEVLAVGPREIEALKRRTDPGEWLGVVEEQVRPWPG
jgi:hypothetical protein